MNRRGFIGSITAALGISAVPAVAKTNEFEDKYWDAQRHINALEDERQYPWDDRMPEDAQPLA